MEHFNVVLGLCRSAMKTQNVAIQGHIERLIKNLEKEGETKQAESLRKLLANGKKSQEIIPSKVVLSRASINGEILTSSVTSPVDKETGDKLAEIIHVESLNNEKKPFFNTELAMGIDSLVKEWEFADALKASDIKPALATMLFGAPGTGKTMLAHYIAAQLGLPLVVARLDGLISSFLGTTARNISNLFTFANRYKCILLLDEFDAIAKLRDDPHELGEIKRVVNTLLQCVDDRADKGYTIAITNHESLLDPAIWRRFDIRIKIPKPDSSTRAAIIKNKLNGQIKDETRLKFLTWVSEGGSGSDIEKLTDFLKRQKVLQKRRYDFFGAVKQYVSFSAHESQSDNRLSMLEDMEKLAVVLAEGKEISFNQSQIAELFSCEQSTISRWIHKDDLIKGDAPGG